MTLKEVAQQLGKSESTLYNNFKRTQQTLLKKGIVLTKWGKDDYEIEYEDVDPDDKTYLEKLYEKRRARKEKKEIGE